MKIAFGLCHCGCGQKTWIPKRTYNQRGWKKGEPVKFVKGHHNNYLYGKFHPAWNGGKTAQRGYPMTLIPQHPKADKDGYVMDHILIAEKALKKPLPAKTEVHHFPKLENFTHIVICENKSYHRILETRYIALKRKTKSLIN
jgi:hypothetical protein